MIKGLVLWLLPSTGLFLGRLTPAPSEKEDEEEEEEDEEDEASSSVVSVIGAEEEDEEVICFLALPKETLLTWLAKRREQIDSPTDCNEGLKLTIISVLPLLDKQFCKRYVSLELR